MRTQEHGPLAAGVEIFFFFLAAVHQTCVGSSVGQGTPGSCVEADAGLCGDQGSEDHAEAELHEYNFCPLL